MKPKNKQFECLTCKKIFINYTSKKRRTFCSVKCWAEYYRGERHHNWKKKKAPRVKLKCLGCEQDYTVLLSLKNLSKFCSRKCKMEKYSKEGHPNWHGGISKNRYYKDFNRDLIHKRDKYKCQECGLKAEAQRISLPIHHIDFNKQNSDPNNLITLCTSCHSKTFYGRKKWILYYRNKLQSILVLPS